MAATRLIPMHQNKGMSVLKSLQERTDYAENGEKTEHGELVTAYACDPDAAPQQFLLAKQEYYRITGRKPVGDIIAYQIRQSFKPGEVSPEEASKIGYETAMRFTKGNHAFIVATHTDRAHIHNHIIYNSTNLACDRKFKNFFLSFLALQKVSDLVCLSHGLSVIEPKPYSQREKRTTYPEKESFRNVIRENIDAILQDSRVKDFDAFMAALESAGYEIKRGKHISVRGKGQKRFIRLRSLGKGYSEDDIRRILAGEEERTFRDEPKSENADTGTHQEKHERDFDLLIDIQKKIAEGKGKGYERFALNFNSDQTLKALLFLKDHGIRDYDTLVQKADETSTCYNELSASIKAKEKRLAEIAVLKTHIINYMKTKEVYASYRKSGYSKKFLEQHRQEILLHKAARKAFDELQVKKLPSLKQLSAEYSEVLAEKKNLYKKYHQARQDMKDYQIAKYNIDRMTHLDEEYEKKQKRQKHRSRDIPR